MDKTKEKSELGRRLAELRHLSLTPERRREIAVNAAQKSVESRREKRRLTEMKNSTFQKAS